MSENETTAKEAPVSKTPNYDTKPELERADIDNRIKEIRERTEKNGQNYSPDQEWRMREAFAKQNSNQKAR